MTDYGQEWQTIGQGGAMGSREGRRGHQRPPGGLSYFRHQKSDKTAKQWLQTMFISTQGVSRPKRYSRYLFISGAFGAIGLHYNSDIKWKPKLLKFGKNNVLKKEYSHASTDHQEQFLIGSSIFHSPWHTQGLWKIEQPIKNCSWWSVEAWEYSFSWNHTVSRSWLTLVTS